MILYVCVESHTCLLHCSQQTEERKRGGERIAHGKECIAWYSCIQYY